MPKGYSKHKEETFMAKEDALRFMVVMEKDEKIKSAFNSIMHKYEGMNLSKDEWDKAIKNEVIPFAKKNGFDFIPEDLAELQKTAGGEISDEELDQVAGGRGEFSETIYSMFVSHVERRMACDFAPDDQTFKTRYYQNPTDCPDFVSTNSWARTCLLCAHFNIIGVTRY